MPILILQHQFVMSFVGNLQLADDAKRVFRLGSTSKYCQVYKLRQSELVDLLELLVQAPVQGSPHVDVHLINGDVDLGVHGVLGFALHLELIAVVLEVDQRVFDGLRQLKLIVLIEILQVVIANCIQ